MASLRGRAKYVKNVRHQLKKATSGKKSTAEALKTVKGMQKGRKKFRKIKPVRLDEV